MTSSLLNDEVLLCFSFLFNYCFSEGTLLKSFFPLVKEEYVVEGDLQGDLSAIFIQQTRTSCSSDKYKR